MAKKFALGIITARGGSKGIKHKNIVSIGGKPLIVHTVDSALKSELDDVIVSTDSKKIADVAKKAGASVPFMRPKALSGDKTSSLPVLKHALKEYESISGKKVDIVVLLQPTSPFRKAKHINDAIRLISSGKADSVFSVVPLEVSPNWLMKIDKKRLKFAFGSNFSKIRRQDLGNYYRMHGLIKAFTCEVLTKAKKYPFGKKAMPLVTSKKVAVEIDDPEDLEIAKKLFK